MSVKGIEADKEKTIGFLTKLLKGKADSFEIFIYSDRGLSAEAKDGEVDALKVKSNCGLSIRTISKQKLGFGFSSVLTEEALKELVENTVSGSSEAGEDRFLRFPEGALPVRSQDTLELFDDSFSNLSDEEKISKALEIEESARSFDPRIKRVRKASYQETVVSTRVVNSNGVDTRYSATFYSGSVMAVAEEGGESQMGWETGTGHRIGSIDPALIGKGAARRAVDMLGARQMPTAKCPAVIENTVAMEMLGSLASSFLGDNVEKGKSMLANKIGKKVVSGTLNIWDDGLLPGGWSSSFFDGEGTARGKTPLVSGGACMGYLYDTYWAGRAGVRSTGNASRSGYKSLPGAGVSNLYIEGGEKTQEDLMSELHDGIFITELLGVHTINSVTGEFSLGATGFKVSGGKNEFPVRGMAVSGNLLDLFSRVEACGRDVRFIGSVGAPSLLIDEIEVSGS